MDVHFQVEEYLQQLQHTLTTHHVKGHQTGPNLNWEAQLNNRADKLATEAQKQLTTLQKIGATTKYPACKAHVQVNGQIITRNYDKELQHAYTLHDFRKKWKTNSNGKSCMANNRLGPVRQTTYKTNIPKTKISSQSHPRTITGPRSTI